MNSALIPYYTMVDLRHLSDKLMNYAEALYIYHPIYGRIPKKFENLEELNFSDIGEVSLGQWHSIESLYDYYAHYEEPDASEEEIFNSVREDIVELIGTRSLYILNSNSASVFLYKNSEKAGAIRIGVHNEAEYALNMVHHNDRSCFPGMVQPITRLELLKSNGMCLRIDDLPLFAMLSDKDIDTSPVRHLISVLTADTCYTPGATDKDFCVTPNGKLSYVDPEAVPYCRSFYDLSEEERATDIFRSNVCIYNRVSKLNLPESFQWLSSDQSQISLKNSIIRHGGMEMHP